MAEEPFSFFENSPLASNNSDFPQFSDPILDYTGYVTNAVHKDRLLELFSNADNEHLTFVNYDIDSFKNDDRFKLENIFTIDPSGISIDFSAFPKDFVNYFTVIANSKSGKIIPTPSVEIIPNPKKFKAEYKITFYYSIDTPIAHWDEFRKDSVLINGISHIIEAFVNHVIAIEFTTNVYYAFSAAIGRFKNLDTLPQTRKAFLETYNSISRSESVDLRNFYMQCPKIVLEKLSFDALFSDFLVLLGLDNSVFEEANHALIKCLGVLVHNPSGMNKMWDIFNRSPELTKHIYDTLDGNSTIKGITQPNKTVFASLILALINWQEQNLPAERNKSSIKFRVDETHMVDGNSVFSDSKPGRYNLQQLYLKKQKPNFHPHNLNPDQKFWVTAGELHYLHPLDVVTLLVKDQNGNNQSLLVPAIFIKDISYHWEWNIISAALRVGINLLIIALSPVTLLASPGLLFTILAIAELGLSITDITIKVFEEEISSLPGGKEFLDAWESLYFTGGMITGAALLPSLLKSGAKILITVGSKEAQKQLIQMLSFSLNLIENFPKFVKNKFDIILDFTSIKKVGPEFRKRMQTLSEKGVLLLKGTPLDERAEKYFLNYKGVNFSEGNIQKIQEDVQFLFKKGNAEITEILEDVFEQYSKRVISDVGFEILPKNLLQKNIKDAISNAKSKGIILEVKTIDIQHPRYFDNTFYGSLNLTDSRKKLILFHREECPKITWFHEMQHLEDFFKLGHKKYKSISINEPWLHERSVWEKILKNKTKFREIEVIDAYAYVRSYYITRGKEHIFDLTVKNMKFENKILDLNR